MRPFTALFLNVCASARRLHPTSPSLAADHVECYPLLEVARYRHKYRLISILYPRLVILYNRMRYMRRKKFMISAFITHDERSTLHLWQEAQQTTCLVC